jgi:hypothetical protein
MTSRSAAPPRPLMAVLYPSNGLDLDMDLNLDLLNLVAPAGYSVLQFLEQAVGSDLPKFSSSTCTSTCTIIVQLSMHIRISMPFSVILRVRVTGL